MCSAQSQAGLQTGLIWRSLRSHRRWPASSSGLRRMSARGEILLDALGLARGRDDDVPFAERDGERDLVRRSRRARGAICLDHRLAFAAAAGERQIAGHGNSVGRRSNRPASGCCSSGWRSNWLVGDPARPDQCLGLFEIGNGEVGDADQPGQAARLRLDEFGADSSPSAAGHWDDTGQWMSVRSRLSTPMVSALCRSDGMSLPGWQLVPVILVVRKTSSRGRPERRSASPHFVLGIVALRGVEVAIAGLERVRDGGDALLARRPKVPKPMAGIL